MANLEKLLSARQRVLLVGPPATMKTSIVHEAAREAGFDFITTCAGIKERVDFSGGMVPDLKRKIMVELPLETMQRLLNAERPTVWFLDDIGNGPVDVQAGIKSQITSGGPLDRTNPNVVICAATNCAHHKTGANALHEALRSEFDRAYEMPTPNVEDKPGGPVLFETWPKAVERWTNWAMDNDCPAWIIAWHRSTTGRTLYQWQPHANPAQRMPDFRTWHAAFKGWNQGFRSQEDLASCIGKPAAAEAMGFFRFADKLPTPDQVRMDPMGAPVPTEPGPQYLITTMLGMSAQPGDAGAFCKYLGRLPRTFGALLGKDMYRRLGANLSGNPQWVKWFTENQALFQV